MNATVEITETRVLTFHIDDVRSPEEAEDIAFERLEDEDYDEVETLDTQVNSFTEEE